MFYPDGLDFRQVHLLPYMISNFILRNSADNKSKQVNKSLGRMKRLFSLKAHPSSLILKESSPKIPRRVVLWQSKVLRESPLLST